MATKATGKTASKARATKVKAVEDIKAEEVAEIKAEPVQQKGKTYTEDELNAIIAQKIVEAMEEEVDVQLLPMPETS